MLDGMFYICHETDIGKWERFYRQPEEEKERTFILIREETYRELFLAIKELPKRNQEIFVLHILGKRDDEIAETLSLAVHVVHDDKKESIRLLKKRLGDQYDWFLWMKNVRMNHLYFNKL